MKLFISKLLVQITLVSTLFMIGCSTDPISSDVSQENDIKNNSIDRANKAHMRMVITQIPYNDNDNPETFQYAYETSYTHWYGKKFGLKISVLPSGSRFYHAPNGDWSRAFYSDRVDYLSDAGRQYTATLESHATFRHRRRYSTKSHVSDRIHFIDKNSEKKCVRLQQEFSILGNNYYYQLNHVSRDYNYPGESQALLIGEKFYVKNLETGEKYVDYFITYTNSNGELEWTCVFGSVWHRNIYPYTPNWIYYYYNGVYTYTTIVDWIR